MAINLHLLTIDKIYEKATIHIYITGIIIGK